MVKFVQSVREAISHIRSNDAIAVSGFGLAGQPQELVEALVDAGVSNLTIVANNAGNGESGLARLLATGAVSKIICSFPRQVDSHVFDGLFRAGHVELELVPQGTLAERLRAAGAGLAGFYTRTGAGTPIAEGKETRIFRGKEFIFEHALPVDVALVKAHRADTYGNLTYRKTARNFGPVMAMAAAHTVVQVEQYTRGEAIDPEHVITPSIFVDRIVHLPTVEVQDA